MTATRTRPRFSPVRDSHDLLAAIPAVLGYRPVDSIVVVACESSVVKLTMRLDLDWFAVDYDLHAEHLLSVREHMPDAMVFLLGYSSDIGAVSVSMFEAAELLGDLADVLVTNGERWWSLCCPGDCCPEEGHPFSYESSAITAQAVFAGVSVTRDRSEVVARVAGPGLTEQQRLAAVFAEEYTALLALSDREAVERLITLRQQFHCSSDPLDEHAAAQVAILLDEPDASAALFDELDVSTADVDLEWLLQTSALCLERYAPQVLAFMATAAWLAGGGPVLTAARERLHRLQPNHAVLALLNGLIARLIPPSVWQGSR